MATRSEHPSAVTGGDRLPLQLPTLYGDRTPGGPFPRESEGGLDPYLRAVRGHKLVVVLALLAAIGGASAWLLLRSPTYEATAKVLVAPLPPDDTTFLGLQVIRDSGDPSRTVQTGAALLESPEAAVRAAKTLGGSPPNAVASAVDVEPEGESNVLAVTARADDPGEGARLADAYARAALAVRGDQIRTQIDRLLPQLKTNRAALDAPSSVVGADLAAKINQLEAARAGEDPTLTFSQAAIPPASPVGAPPTLVLALALIAGLAIGSGAAVLLELVGTRIRDEEEAASLYPLPVLARVPKVPQRMLDVSTGATWLMPPGVREAFRTVFVQLNENRDGKTRAVMLTSATTEDGKTTSTINLAVGMAASGHRVVLIDSDVRKPAVQQALGMDHSGRLSTLLDPRATVEDMLIPVPHLPSLSVLTIPGGVEGDPILVETTSQRLPRLMEEARQHADFIVIDTAPLGEVSDALRLVQEVDDVIVVVRPGNTKRSSFEVMRDLLMRSGVTPRGMLTVGQSQNVTSAYYQYGLAARKSPKSGRRLARVLHR